MCPDMMDKSVATEGDFNGEGEWKRVQLESLLAALVDSKVVAMKADTGYYKYQKAPKLPKHHHIHHHHHKHCRRMGDERYVTLDMEGVDEETPRRKRKRRRRNIDLMTSRQNFQKIQKPVDPEDLPKRARWTIIITAGFLLLTCMLLVGITLRMAPIIDQMVHNQNEELMNSLNRQDYNETFLMFSSLNTN
ncbi:uncharacterized protein [Halyomorpha halys]|uniref:uncharacterized protein isoform X2 n=1 Tax=Halyomorpha halys TaxID=286706 RepID=UPI0034D1BDE4